MTSLATGLSCDEYAPFLSSFGLPLYKQRLLVARFLGTQCVDKTVSVFLQKCSLYPGTVKAAGATLSAEPACTECGRKFRSSGGGGWDPQAFT